MLEHLQAGGPVMVPIILLSILGVMNFLERLWALSRFLKPAQDAMLALISSVSAQNIETRLEEEAHQRIASFERGTFLLGIAASIAPMLGLLGTVLGMIITFDDIQNSGIGDPQSLAGGISQALITTFAGLAVGIPSLIGHRWLLKEIDRKGLELEKFCREHLDGAER